MSDFKVHDIDSAPQDSRDMLKQSEQDFGMLPNLHGVMAESPQVLEAYKTLHHLFGQSSLNDDEKTVVWMTVNKQNHCHYCTPAHTAIAKSMGIDDGLIEDLRQQRPLSDPRLETLRQTTQSLVQARGELSKQAMARFFEAGFSQQNLLDVILGVSQKVLSNYVNHVADTPLDEPFKKFA